MTMRTTENVNMWMVRECACIFIATCALLHHIDCYDAKNVNGWIITDYIL